MILRYRGGSDTQLTVLKSWPEIEWVLSADAGVSPSARRCELCVLWESILYETKNKERSVTSSLFFITCHFVKEGSRRSTVIFNMLFYFTKCFHPPSLLEKSSFVWNSNVHLSQPAAAACYALPAHKIRNCGFAVLYTLYYTTTAMHWRWGR